MTLSDRADRDFRFQSGVLRKPVPRTAPQPRGTDRFEAVEFHSSAASLRISGRWNWSRERAGAPPGWGYPHFLLREKGVTPGIYRKSTKGDFESRIERFLVSGSRR